jgi:hypothetical protein
MPDGPSDLRANLIHAKLRCLQQSRHFIQVNGHAMEKLKRACLILGRAFTLRNVFQRKPDRSVG